MTQVTVIATIGGTGETSPEVIGSGVLERWSSTQTEPDEAPRPAMPDAMIIA